jgi:hypothetical protein
MMSDPADAERQLGSLPQVVPIDSQWPAQVVADLEPSSEDDSAINQPAINHPMMTRVS